MYVMRSEEAETFKCKSDEPLDSDNKSDQVKRVLLQIWVSVSSPSWTLSAAPQKTDSWSGEVPADPPGMISWSVHLGPDAPAAVSLIVLVSKNPGTFFTDGQGVKQMVQ